MRIIHRPLGLVRAQNQQVKQFSPVLRLDLRQLRVRFLPVFREELIRRDKRFLQVLAGIVGLDLFYRAGTVLERECAGVVNPVARERLVSRFKWGLVTELEMPCYETRVAILKRKSRQRGRELPDDVAGLLAERIDNNIRELEGAITKLFGYSDLSGQPVTADLARTALRDVFSARRGGPTIDNIVSVVTEEFGVKLSDLQSRRRTAAIAFPRQIAMYLARKITRHSLEEVGGHFGGRDHSTVLYAVTKITALIERDPETAELISGLLERLGERPL